MKKVFFYSFLITLLAACSSDPKSNDKKNELDKLRKEQAELKEKITKLEAEIAASDTSADNTKLKIVSVTDMKTQPFHHYIEVQAKVEGDEDVLVSAQSMGSVTAVNSKAGDVVSNGQVLATIDDRAINQTIAEVQTQLDLATQVYNRQKNLWDQKIGSEIQYLQTKASKESLEKRLATLQDQLDLTRIKSPISGTVDAVHIKIGETMAPGIPAFRVVNLSSLKVTGEVAESFINAVKTGNDAILYFPDMKKEIKTKLSYSGKVINKLNRTFNVEVRLPKQDLELHPNMIAVLKIGDYTAPSAFVLPIGSVQKSGEGEFVYVAIKDKSHYKVQRKSVVSGVNYNGYAEILSGLEEGDRVITNGYQNVIEGDFIQL